MNKKNKCPCCGFYTLSDDAGHYDICPVCFWEDDPIQSDDIYYEGGANGICLKEAREKFEKIGAVSKGSLQFVRHPLDDELPENNVDQSHLFRACCTKSKWSDPLLTDTELRQFNNF